jgi:hypothetical protein
MEPNLAPNILTLPNFSRFLQILARFKKKNN